MKILYSLVIKKALELKLVSQTSKILVVGGGPNDSETLQNFHFQNVIISNLAPHSNVTNYHPYKWRQANINALPYDTNHFDFVIVSASLHHLYSPHKGLGEMLRVSKKAIMIIESSDNFLSRISRKLRLVPDYEIDAVLRDGTGGVENSPIPNYIYRWTKTEIKKTVNTYLPHSQNKFYFFHHYEFPIARLKRSKSLFVKAILPMVFIVGFILKKFFPRQANEFGVLVEKGKSLHPWLEGTIDNPTLNLTYIRTHFKTDL